METEMWIVQQQNCYGCYDRWVKGKHIQEELTLREKFLRSLTTEPAKFHRSTESAQYLHYYGLLREKIYDSFN